MAFTYLGKVTAVTTKTTIEVKVGDDVCDLKRRCIHPRSRLTDVAKKIMDWMVEGEKLQSIRIDSSDYFDH